MRNRYIQKSHVSEKKFREIVRGFCLDLTAQDMADLVGVNRLFELFRERILSHTLLDKPLR